MTVYMHSSDSVATDLWSSVASSYDEYFCSAEGDSAAAEADAAFYTQQEEFFDKTIEEFREIFQAYYNSEETVSENNTLLEDFKHLFLIEPFNHVSKNAIAKAFNFLESVPSKSLEYCSVSPTKDRGILLHFNLNGHTVSVEVSSCGLCELLQSGEN